MTEGTTAGASGPAGTSGTGAADGGTGAADAAGGGRWVDVAPERLARWVATFAERHGAVTAGPGRLAVTFRAADGAAAECHPPFPPLPAPSGGAWPADPADLAGLIAAHAAADRTVGVLLVRLGGFAAGVFAGSPPRLISSKVGTRLVHGRSAAGGTPQRRFARRRENQATAAIDAAADTAVKVLVPYAERLDALVLGGDRKAVSGVRADPRLRPVMKQAVERFLTVPDPRLAVLRDAPRLFLAVRIRLTGPA
jgi:Actinobacteria/chloroflexi VLRF1 release factor